jgi:hypothetical protein
MTLGPLAGAWKLISAYVEFADTGERWDTLGPDPSGWIMFTEDGRMAGLLTAGGRANPEATADYEQAFKSMVAYTGQVRLAGDGMFINTVDIAWYPGWTGTEQVRYFRIEGDILHIRTPEQTLPNFGERRLVSVVTWRRSVSATPENQRRCW